MQTNLTQEPEPFWTPKAPVRIVVIDDHKLLRDGLRALLASEKGTMHMTGEAGTAHEGFALVRREQPDLVVLDLNLPDQHGTRLATEIRRAWPAIKILVLSGSGSGGVASEIARAGADGFVRKEDAAEEFLRAIPMVMSGRSYFSPAAADAIARSMWSESDSQAAVKPAKLADRERQVLRGFAEGLSYKQIAAQMNVSVRTAETYRARLVQKLGCSTRAEMVRYAIRHGLVEA
ncbi:MAG TPA: response regulator transcription factor [Opitutaceae bacterium]|nr:response regulator transcription factor [Opitutaceae bacterium]